LTRPERKREELSPRERVRLAISHQQTDRVPITLVCAGLEPPTRRALARHLDVDPDRGVDHYLEEYIDLITVGPSFRNWDPDYRGPTLSRSPAGYDDIWGGRWEPISYGEGVNYEISRFPLADARDIDDLRRHRWPDPDWWDYSALRDRIAHAAVHRDYALMIMSGNPFERTWWMRGFERTFMDMYDRPDFYHYIIGRITDFHVETTRRALEAADGRVDFAFTGDDIAGQTGLLMSLSMWEEFIKPYHVRLNEVIHSFGAKVVYHSDGGVMDAIPGLIHMGIDVLQALQFSADGMDPVAMKQRYGDCLCFEGGISVQTTLPFGSVEDVRQEVRDLIGVLGKGGGYILSPSHALVGGIPPENIVAMFETAAATPMGSS
jgi:uroporphyrinogen decarboxylase